MYPLNSTTESVGLVFYPLYFKLEGIFYQEKRPKKSCKIIPGNNQESNSKISCKIIPGKNQESNSKII